MRSPRHLFFFALLLLPACFGSNGPQSVQFLYDPAAGVLPVPNDFLFAGTLDLTLNAPVADPADTTDPAVQLNAVDGWSTVAPFVLQFNGAVDAASASAAGAVRIFEVTTDTSQMPVGGPVQAVVAELGAADFDVLAAAEDASGATLRVRPLRPLDPSTTYMVVVTDELRGSNGARVASSPAYRQLVQTFSVQSPVIVALQSMQAAAATQGIRASRIVVSFTFTTQSIGAVLNVLHASANGGEQAVLDGLAASGVLDTSAGSGAVIPAAAISVDAMVGPTPGTLADIHVGGINLPYFLTPAANGSATLPVVDFGPVTTWFAARFPFLIAGGADLESNLTGLNSMPRMRGVEQVAVMITVPNANSGQTKPAGGWPVALFQHGITGNRSQMLGIADQMAAVGFAVVAIDLPLHGLDATSPFFSGYMDGGRRERTFGLDLLDNASGAPGPDGSVDGSGSHFLNIPSPLTSRDNLRQAASDLFHLAGAVHGIDFIDGPGGDLDEAGMAFIGHSLGGIVGVNFLEYEQRVATATLAMPGGGLPKLLEGSAAFGPVIVAGLQAAGLVPGTAEWEQFFQVSQTLVDAGDPINHTGGQHTTRPTHFIEVVGGALGLPDLVVPNAVADAPLAGSDPLIEALGLTQVSTTTVDPAGLRVVTRFTQGFHSSLLDPFSDPAAWAEMQMQTGLFHFFGGGSLVVTDGNVVQ